jgi:hypothetical protein
LPQALAGYGGQGRNRTNDTRIFSPLLYRLSYLALMVDRGAIYTGYARLLQAEIVCEANKKPGTWPGSINPAGDQNCTR